MSYKIFIDGQEGTTGLQIFERFAKRKDLSLVEIGPDVRKSADARLACMSGADVTILCLPDEASREIVAAADRAGTAGRIIDASTAFRTAAGWVYGLPELERGQRERIAAAERVALPGCHATGFVLIAKPLIAMGVVDADYPFSCHSVTGYSGGGKKMIADYAAHDLHMPRQYGIGQRHKHLPEMQALSGARASVVFTPIVADYYSGLLVTVPLHGALFRKKAGPQALYEMFSDYYRDQALVRTVPPGAESEDGFLRADSFAGRNDLELLFYGQEDRLVIAARFDNLGKGASGAAVQCMNLMLGLPETTGLS
ncbi:MAG: N-acetyl-gamma-glutamyl-phosphate reductase [Clostridiales Family XIII bacterium]|jgi:N-acetyl-gamma-glutamyl-phosphate reductase|nr:N-acetyl-gamma-glutamyl-phosphate reductase [Clostridiales Family XIII bacterium]